jgi:hypothetical protein
MPCFFLAFYRLAPLIMISVLNFTTMQEMISLKSSTKGPGRTKGQTTENSTPKLKQEQETDEV